MGTNLDKVNHAIQHRLILCTGTGWRRKDWVIATYRNDIRLLRFKKIFFATNDPDNRDLCFDQQKPVTQFFPHIVHQVDCINSILTCMQKAIQDPEILDDDIFLFKHESSFAKDLYLIQKTIGAIVLNGYDAVVQTIRGHYYSGIFFIKASAARIAFQGLSLLNQMPPDLPFCELYLTHRPFSKVRNVYRVPTHYIAQDDRLGFFKIATTDIPNGGVWDKSDYNQLFHDVHLDERS